MKTLTIELEDIAYLNLKNIAKALKLSEQDTIIYGLGVIVGLRLLPSDECAESLNKIKAIMESFSHGE
jgi:hypothetical protein